eukprot:g17706.t1
MSETALLPFLVELIAASDDDRSSVVLTPEWLFKVLEAVDFPVKNESRKNVTPKGQYFALGCVGVHDGTARESTETRARTVLVRILTTFAKKHLGEDVKFTSIQVNKNADAKLHVDGRNSSLIHAIALVDEAAGWGSNEESAAGNTFVMESEAEFRRIMMLAEKYTNGSPALYRGPEAQNHGYNGHRFTLDASFNGQVVHIKNRFGSFDGSKPHVTIPFGCDDYIIDWRRGGAVHSTKSSGSSTGPAACSSNSGSGWRNASGQRQDEATETSCAGSGCGALVFDDLAALAATTSNKPKNPETASLGDEDESGSGASSTDGLSPPRKIVIDDAVLKADSDKLAEIVARHRQSASMELRKRNVVLDDELTDGGSEESDSGPLHQDENAKASSLLGAKSFSLGKLKKCDHDQIQLGISISGYGCIAGPVVAACFVKRPGIELAKELQKGILNPRAFTRSQRQEIFDRLAAVEETQSPISFKVVSNEEIDALGGVKKAAHQAVDYCLQKVVKLLGVEQLGSCKIHVSGFFVTESLRRAEDAGEVKILRIKDAKTTDFLIAAAGFVSKVLHDDEVLDKMHAEHPEFGFDKHVGYVSPGHQAALVKHGPTKYHRTTTKSVRECVVSSGSATSKQKKKSARACCKKMKMKLKSTSTAPKSKKITKKIKKTAAKMKAKGAALGTSNKRKSTKAAKGKSVKAKGKTTARVPVGMKKNGKQNQSALVKMKRRKSRPAIAPLSVSVSRAKTTSKKSTGVKINKKGAARRKVKCVDNNSNTAVADGAEDEQDEDAKLVESGDPELIALERELQKQMQQFCPQLMVAQHQDEQEPPRSRPGDTTPNSSDRGLRASLSASSSSLSNLVGAGGANASFAGTSASQLSTPNTKRKVGARGVSSVSKRDRDREANGLRREQGDAKIADLLRQTDEQFFRLPRAAGAAGKLVDVDTQVDELAGLKLEMQMLENALGEAQSADEVAHMSGAAVHEHDNYDKEGTGSVEQEIENQRPPPQPTTTSAQSYVVDAVTQLALEELGALEKEWTALKKKEQAMCAVEELQHEKGSNCCSLLQPGLLLRSGAFDSIPCGWRDIGSPRTIVNLREFSADETYSRLAGEAASSHAAAVEAEAKADGVGDPHSEKSENFKLEVWNCSAANDQEKYDVRNCEVRDWILGVITRLLESPGATDHVEGRLSATAEACSSESQGLASAVAAFLAEYSAAVEGLEKALSPKKSGAQEDLEGAEIHAGDHRCQEDEGLALLHAISPFRLALSFLLREALCVCGPTLVHCRFGRDRTGIVVAAVLTAICPTDIAFRYCAEEVERRFAVCRKIDVSVAEELECLTLWLLYGYSRAALKEASGRITEEMQLLQLRVAALFAAKRLREVKQRLTNAENLASLILPVQMSPLAHLVCTRLPGHWGCEESGSKQFKKVEARLESFIREVGEKRASSRDKPLKAVGVLKWIRKVLGT